MEVGNNRRKQVTMIATESLEFLYFLSIEMSKFATLPILETWETEKTKVSDMCTTERQCHIEFTSSNNILEVPGSSMP